MDTWVWVVIVIAILVVAALAYVAWSRSRSGRLQERFGPEYERTVDEADSRRDAEKDLAARAKRRESLDIKPLAPAARDRFAARWTEVQAHFVDAPGPAVDEADRLVLEVMEA